MNEDAKIATVVLAAGESKRMGSPKQLIEWQGKSLIQHIIDKSLQTSTHKTFVVYGANAEKILPVIQHNNIHLIENKEWQNGLGSSISTSAKFIQKHFDDVDAILFCLVDQPLVTVEHLQEIVKIYRKKEKSIVATSYKNRYGVPAIFDKKYFEELSALEGKTGAKSVIRNHLDNAALLPFEDASLDLDTPEDLEFLK